MSSVVAKGVEKEFSVIQVTTSGATSLYRPVVTIIGGVNGVAEGTSRGNPSSRSASLSPAVTSRKLKRLEPIRRCRWIRRTSVAEGG